jgi:hypothetical protein
MKSVKSILLFTSLVAVFIGCSKEEIEAPVRLTSLTPAIYTFPSLAGPLPVPTKKLKIKLLDNETNRGVKDAVFYIKAMGRKANCIGYFGCDSLLYEDSVVTDDEGNALITKRGNYEVLRAVKGYWELSQLKQTYSFADYDSTVIKLWPEVWVKLEIKNVKQYDNSYVFSPRLECTGLRSVYQTLVGINKDTLITERLWANQNYKVSLNLYKNVPGTLNGAPEQVLSQFNQFIGKDTTTIVLSY